jgi:hypothetical protein
MWCDVNLIERRVKVAVLLPELAVGVACQEDD